MLSEDVAIAQVDVKNPEPANRDVVTQIDAYPKCHNDVHAVFSSLMRQKSAPGENFLWFLGVFIQTLVRSAVAHGPE